MSFCTVSSPMIRFRSSGDSPGGKPCACALAFGLRLSPKKNATFCLNPFRQRGLVKLVTPYFSRTASIVVSRCKLSSTTFALNSAVYCCRFLVVISFRYLSGERLLPYTLVHYIRYQIDHYVENKRIKYAIDHDRYPRYFSDQEVRRLLSTDTNWLRRTKNS